MISPSSTNPKVTQVGDYIFRVCFIDPFQGAVMAKFAHDTLKVKKVAILVDVRSDYSVGLQTFFGQAFKKLGGDDRHGADLQPGRLGLQRAADGDQGPNPEAIYVPGYYTEVGTIARQARELGITVPLSAATAGTRRSSGRSAARRLNGCYFSNHYSADDPNPVVQKFVNDYKAKYGETPDALAALGYDAARILADAMTRADSTEGSKVRDALAATKDFPGVTGTITLDADRNAVKPAVVLKIENGKYLLTETIKPDAVQP